MLIGLAIGSGSARAQLDGVCDPDPCLAPTWWRHLAPADGSTVPANLPCFTAVNPAVAQLQLALFDGLGRPVAASVEPATHPATWILRPAAPLAPGHYMLRDGSCAEPYESRFRIEPEAPVPTTIGTVAVSSLRPAEFTTRLSCFVGFRAHAVDLDIRLSPELERFRGVARLTLTVGDAVWASTLPDDRIVHVYQGRVRTVHQVHVDCGGTAPEDPPVPRAGPPVQGDWFKPFIPQGLYPARLSAEVHGLPPLPPVSFMIDARCDRLDPALVHPPRLAPIADAGAAPEATPVLDAAPADVGSTDQPGTPRAAGGGCQLSVGPSGGFPGFLASLFALAAIRLIRARVVR